MRRANLVSSVALLGFATFFIWGASRLPMRRQDLTWPGLIPLWEGILLALVALVLLGVTLRQTTEAPVQWPRGEARRMVLRLSVAMFVYLALVQYLGYVTTTFLFMLGTSSAWRRYSWRVIVLSAASLSLILFLVFEVVLRTPLPQSPLGLP